MPLKEFTTNPVPFFFNAPPGASKQALDLSYYTVVETNPATKLQTIMGVVQQRVTDAYGNSHFTYSKQAVGKMVIMCRSMERYFDDAERKLVRKPYDYTNADNYIMAFMIARFGGGVFDWSRE